MYAFSLQDSNIVFMAKEITPSPRHQHPLYNNGLQSIMALLATLLRYGYSYDSARTETVYNLEVLTQQLRNKAAGIIITSHSPRGGTLTVYSRGLLRGTTKVKITPIVFTMFLTSASTRKSKEFYSLDFGGLGIIDCNFIAREVFPAIFSLPWKKACMYKERKQSSPQGTTFILYYGYHNVQEAVSNMTTNIPVYTQPNFLRETLFVVTLQ